MRIALLLILSALPSLAQISFDAAASGNYAGSGTNCWSHTVGAGANRFLDVAVWSRTTDSITSVTYAGVTATLATKNTTNSGVYLYHYYLVNPTTGTNSVCVTAPDETSGVSMSYTGVNQSTPIDATVNNYTTPTVGCSTSECATVSVTTTVDKDWVIASFGTPAQAGTFTINVGSPPPFNPVLEGQAQYGTVDAFDSHAAVTPAGTNTFYTSAGSASAFAVSAIAIEPAAGGPPPSGIVRHVVINK